MPIRPLPLCLAVLCLAVGRIQASDTEAVAAGARAELDGIYRTAAARPVAAHRGPLMQELEPLLVQQARAVVATLQPWSVDPRAAHVPPTPNRPPSGEHGIRPSAHTAKGLALLVRLVPEEAFPASFPRAAARERALAVLRFLVRTHGAAGEACADGKPWRDQWQSAYWATLAGEAAWLLWDDLAPRERWLAARMICDEADRFVGTTPPVAVERDSKGEENAWNSGVVSLAHAMFPRHPRHDAWRETALRWIASSFATVRDTTRTEIVDGRPLREWIAGANLHDDFTLENHSRVHPDYMACTYLLTSQRPMYAWAGLRPPAVIDLNVQAINAILKRLAAPDGGMVYPNGQDWGLRRQVDWLEYHGTMAVLYGDRQSATLLRHSLETVRRMAARAPHGSLYLPGETKLSSDVHMAFELPAHLYALMAQEGEGPEPLPDERLWAELAGTRTYASGKFGLARTRDAIATFSWGAQTMGLVLPLGRDMLLSPEARGLIGYVGLPDGKTDKPLVRTVKVTPFSAGFGVAGVMHRGGEGVLEQRFGFVALPDGRAVYVDVLVPLGRVIPPYLDLGTLGVLNDLAWPYHDGDRLLAYEGGSRRFVAAQAATEAPVELGSPWYNLDERLGIVSLAVSGQAKYVPAPTSSAGRLEQRFHLNVVPAGARAQARPGEPLAYSVLALYPNRGAGATKDAAARCALRSKPGSPAVRLVLDDGTEVSFDLAALAVTVTGRGAAP